MSQVLTSEELQELRSSYAELNSTKLKLAEIEMHLFALEEKKKATIDIIPSLAKSTEEKISAIKDKYGDVRIDMDSGTLTPLE
jgi:hypothetical protein